MNFSYSQSTPHLNDTLSSAQTSFNGMSNVGVPLNADRVQIILRNDTSENSDNSGQNSSFLTTIIATIGIIIASISASILTYRHAVQIEERKRREQNKEEEEFNKRMRQLVSLELTNYSRLLEGLIGPEEDIKKYKSGWKRVLSYTPEYTKMSLEKRVKVFSPNVLTQVEQSYHYFAILSQGFNEEFDRYSNSEITIEQLRNNLAVNQIKSLVDNTVELIETEDNQ